MPKVSFLPTDRCQGDHRHPTYQHFHHRDKTLRFTNFNAILEEERTLKSTDIKKKWMILVSTLVGRKAKPRLYLEWHDDAMKHTRSGIRVPSLLSVQRWWNKGKHLSIIVCLYLCRQLIVDIVWVIRFLGSEARETRRRGERGRQWIVQRIEMQRVKGIRIWRRRKRSWWIKRKEKTKKQNT